MASDCFKFWDSYYDALRRVDDATAGRLVKALCADVFCDEEPDFSDDPMLGMVYDVMRGQAVQSRDISRQARENGAKGRGVKHSKSPAKGWQKGGFTPAKANRKEAKRSEATSAACASRAAMRGGGSAPGAGPDKPPDYDYRLGPVPCAPPGE